MNILHRFAAMCLLLGLVVGTVVAQDTVAVSGNWSATSTWKDGGVPGPTDNVFVDTSLTVTIDISNAVCNNLTANGYVYFDTSAANHSLTVNGDLLVGARGRFRAGAVAPLAARVQNITLMKNLTIENGGSLDMRTGSNPLVCVGRITFAGTANSEIRIPSKVYSSSNAEFNSVIIKKTGGAKVIVASGYVFQNNNTSQSPDTLVLVSGLIETADTTAWVHLSTGGQAVQGGSVASYVNGWLGRGISNTGTPPITRSFEVGDANGYRPLTVRTQDVGGTTGHYVLVRAISGNANTGTSTLTGSIDKVSSGRYYKVSYFPTATLNMPFDKFMPSYEANDGVGSGNTDLRVAYSTDNRVTWKGMAQTVNDTTFIPDKVLYPDSLIVASRVILTSSTSAYVTLARATGTTTNSLDLATSVEDEAPVPSAWTLGQNYPNPFNPSTQITYGVPSSGFVSLTVFNLLGQRVATLVNGTVAAGTHTAIWNGRDESGRVVPTGIYIYRLDGSGASQAKRMILMK